VASEAVRAVNVWQGQPGKTRASLTRALPLPRRRSQDDEHLSELFRTEAVRILSLKDEVSL
jgi:hypothetical protein